MCEGPHIRPTAATAGVATMVAGRWTCVAVNGPVPEILDGNRQRENVTRPSGAAGLMGATVDAFATLPDLDHDPAAYPALDDAPAGLDDP